MNKTVTINISGIVFHIDELAYEKLKNYLNTIKSFYSDSESRAEIMADIESRVAEIFQSKISDSKQAVLMAEVDAMIAIMGNPEVFKEETTEEEKTKKQTEYSQHDYTPKQKRLFRDPDNKVIGGVCSGIGNYFGFDPVWLRLAFAVCFFAFGFGFLIYILLLIIIPKARTTAEKLEMRGEKVNIENIEKTIKEEFEGVKSKFNEFSDDAKKSWANKENKSGLGHFIQQIFMFLGNIIRFIAIFIGKFIAGFFTIAGAILALVALAFIFGSKVTVQDDGGSYIQNMNDIYMMLFNSPDQLLMAKIGLFLLFVIPLLYTVYRGIKYLLGIKTKHKPVKVVTSLLAITGLVICGIVANQLKDDFSVKYKVTQKLPIDNANANPSRTLYLDVNQSVVNNDQDADVVINEEDENNMKFFDFFYSKDKKMKGTVQFNIIKSNTDSFELIYSKYANGATSKIASARANNIETGFSQTDTLLAFDNYFSFDKEDKFRNQRVKVTLKVPVGKSVYLSSNMKDIIYDIKNVTNTIDGDMVNRTWTMTSRGLECIGCKDLQSVGGRKFRSKKIIVKENGKVITIDERGEDNNDNEEDGDIEMPPVPEPPTK